MTVEMKTKRRDPPYDLKLALILAMACLLVSAGGLLLAYNHELQDTQVGLRAAAKRQASLAEMDARAQSDQDSLSPGIESLDELRRATTDQIRSAQRRFRSFSASGMFTLAKREADTIVYALPSGTNPQAPIRVAANSSAAEPMKRALFGQSGVMVGRDYRGVAVIAAYEPIPALGMGLVAKMDLREVRAPFLHSIPLVLALSLVAALGGSLLVVRVTRPLVARLRAQNRELADDVERRRLLTEELEKSRQLYQDLLESLNDFVFSLDANGTVTYASPAVKRMLGYEPREVIGRHFSEFCHHEDRARVVEKREVTLDGRPYPSEYRLMTRDGRICWVRGSSRAVLEGDRVVGLRGIMMDVTQRRAAESRAQQYLDVVGAMMIAINTDGTIVLINPAGCRLLGCAEEDVLGLDWFDNFVPQKERDEVKRVFARLMAGEIEPVEYVENAVVTCDGEERWILWHNAILRDDAGQITGTLSSGSDITERKRSEEALRASELRYRTLFEHVGDCVLVLERDHLEIPIILDANETALAALGYSREELQGKPISLIDPEFSLPALLERKRSLETERAVSFRLKRRRKDGSVFLVESTGTTVKIGETDLILAVERDITERIRAEEALRESERMYRTLFENVAQGVINQNADGTIASANPSAARILGVSQEDLVSGKFYELDRTWIREDGSPFPGDTHPSTVALQTGKPSGPAVMGLRHHRLRSTRWIVASSVPQFREGETTPCGVHTIFTDITQRKRAEDRLRASEHRYRSLHESLMDGYVEVDMKGRFTDFNDTFLRMTGYSADEIKHLTYTNLTPPKWRDWESRIVEEQILARGYSDIYEKEYTRKDGTVFPIELRTFLLRDSRGNPSSMWAIVRDITERRRAETELQRSRERLQEAQAIGKIGHWEWDLVTGEYLWSDEMCRLYERDPAAPPPAMESEFESYFPNDVQPLRDALRRAIETGVKVGVDLHVTLPSGVTAWHHAIIHPGRDPIGRLVRLVGTVQDITDRKRAEAERERLQSQLRHAQKLETIGTLAGGIAHDFNNVLTPILAYSEMAKEILEGDSPAQDHMNRIIGSANRAKDLVRQILTFSRQGEQERFPVELSPIVKEALKLVRASIPTTIDIAVNIEPHTGTVLADPSQIHQVLMNLCTNAYHAMRDHGGVLTVSMEPRTLDEDSARIHPDLRPGTYVCLTVSDTGCGMDTRTVERIFEPFFTTKDVGEGTGLGLSVVSGIVSRHGGAIVVHSQPGQGSTLEVYLPSIPSEKQVQPIAKDRPAGGDERILVVDDEPEVAESIRRMLESFGYAATVRTSSVDALEIVRQLPHGFDVVLTDQMMPRMTGEQLAQVLLAIRPDLPIILMTGYSPAIDESKCRELGIQAFLTKPLVPSEIARAVRAVLDRTLVAT